MPDYVVPQQLVQLFKQRQVIPFVGAGFSSVFGLPTWIGLLENLAHGAGDDLTFEDVARHAGDDHLRIAEYYFVKRGRHIGPIRHEIADKLRTSSVDPLESGHHVDLVNLGATRVYTTNYDDLLEKTYERLGVPREVIVLPRDVASSAGAATQIVKFHGDLQYEDTLVLTESSYYSRLDFDSPMDLKFRADLLGRAVLFLGYSFSDLNIRVIWFKLNQMMRGVAPQDRPNSYIVTFDSNPVLETLYEEVGITPIVLDPNGLANSALKKSTLLSDFMLDLSIGVQGNASHSGTEKPFVSKTVLGRLESEIDTIGAAVSTGGNIRGVNFGPLERDLQLLVGRVILPEFVDHVSDLIIRSIRISAPRGYQANFDRILQAAIPLHSVDPESSGVLAAAIVGLCSEQERESLRQSSLD